MAENGQNRTHLRFSYSTKVAINSKVSIAFAREQHSKYQRYTDLIALEAAQLDEHQKGMVDLRAKLREVDATIARAEELLEKQSLEKKKPSLFFSHMALPAAVIRDFRLNLEECYDSWVDEFGEKRATWIWRRQEFGLISRYWFDTIISALERARKVIW